MLMIGVPQATALGVITLQNGEFTIIGDSITLPQIAFLSSLLSSEPSMNVLLQVEG